jgi:23S rRNA (guanosine2251-2'-O)-methyltransferase
MSDKNNQEDICWGRNPVLSLLEDFPEKCTKVLIGKNIQQHIKAHVEDLCRAARITFMTVDAAALDRISNKENHQGLIAYMSPVKLWDIEELLPTLPCQPSAVMVLLCDHVQDPHNLGAMIRSAEIAGASAVVMPKRGGCLPTGTVVKTSAGAALRLPLAKTGNIAQTIKLFQDANFWTVGLSMDANETLFKNDMPPRLLLVIGAEGVGLSQLAAKTCDELRHIPMRGKTGSLNASVAAALAMFEWARSN